jgi:uncharacterized protein YfaS (alpha-2-macroglobulin family)
MWGPRGYQIVTPNIKSELGIRTSNIDNVDYRLQKLRPSDILVRENLNDYYTVKELFNHLQTPWSERDITLNEAKQGHSTFNLQPLLSAGEYGAVAYSLQAPVDCYDQPITYDGLILRTDIGIFTQFHPTGGGIKLNRLTDGAHIDGAAVKVYREDELPRLERIWDLINNTNITSIQPCVEGTTDADGMLMLRAEDMTRCTKREATNKVLNALYPPEADPEDILYDRQKFGFAEPPQLLIVVEKGDDWTFLQTNYGGNPSIWQFGVAADWQAEQPVALGTLFSDQYIYRPGDTVKIKGISRYLLYGNRRTGEGLEYDLKLRDPQGGEKDLGKAKVSEFGTFHFDIGTQVNQMLGTYTVSAEHPGSNMYFYGHFRLAEFRVPEFQVSLQSSKKYVLPDEEIELDWEGKYYFGAPMKDAKAALNITRRRLDYFKPDGWEQFSFGLPHSLQKNVGLSGTYHRGGFTLNENGQGSFSFSLSSSDIPYPMTYMCDLEVEDVSRQTISANKALTTLPDHRLIGIRVDNWIVRAGDSVAVAIIVTAAEGTPQTDVAVQVKLMNRRYHSVRSKTPDGRYQAEQTVVDEIEQTKIISSKQEPVSVMLSPKEAGSYYILAELQERPESGTAAASYLWVSGRNYVPWADDGEDKLEIVLDKQEYEIGDIATAFIKSPFPQAELFFSVSRDDMMHHTTRIVQGSAIIQTFQITAEMLPNAYVGAAIFRLAEAIVPVAEEEGKHIERIGFAPFGVSLDSKKLDVQVIPSENKLRPEDELRVDLSVGIENKGVRSELAVMVVDEAVLALTGYRPPDLVETVYRHRGLSARINDNRPFVITEEELLQKGFGYGGGMLGSLDDPKVRKNFLKLAYYDPSLVTDEQGKAGFTCQMPDNLTTWRIMVVAVGEGDRFGYGDSQVVVTQPFIIRPVLPRFARYGDEFRSGVAVTNLTQSQGTVSVKTELGNEAVSLVAHEGLEEGLVIEPGQSHTVLFPLKASGIGEASIKFVAHFDGVFNGRQIQEGDAVQTTLEVHDLLATETVVAVGETGDRFLQKIKIDDSVRKDIGGLQLSLSSTALTNIGEGARYLVDYPYGCLEQTSSRLLTLMQLQNLSEKYGFSLDAVKSLDEVIAANTRKVLLMQNNDGGFKTWPSGNESNCYLSPYVAYMIHQSRALGRTDVPADVSDRLLTYLDKTLRDPCYQLWSWKSTAEYRLNILIGMYFLGHQDQTYFEEYFSRRNELSIGAQIHLAFLLSQVESWRNEATSMLTEIKNSMFVTARTAHIESPIDLPPSWAFLYSPVITTAQFLKLLLEMEPDTPDIAKMARYILNARKNGRWRNTYENARAIDGLVQISLRKESVPPDFMADVVIAARTAISEKFHGFEYQPKHSFLEMANLPSGQNDVLIRKQGKGTLYYTLHYSYRLQGPQTARDQGLRITRTVKNADSGDLIAKYEETPAELAAVKAGDVLEVELQYTVRQTGYHVVIDDPLPAGVEGIDTSLKTTGARNEDSSPQRRRSAPGYHPSPVNHPEMRDDRVVLVADQVDPGVYQYKYMARATTSGHFLWPAAKIELMYEPEQFGTCSEGMINIIEADAALTGN